MRQWKAFDIIEDLGEEMDLMRDPTGVRWRCWLSRGAYKVVKAGGYVYEKDGGEYVRVWDNRRIPCIIHMRRAGELLDKNGEPTDEIEALREIDDYPG